MDQERRASNDAFSLCIHNVRPGERDLYFVMRYLSFVSAPAGLDPTTTQGTCEPVFNITFCGQGTGDKQGVAL